MRAMVLGSPRPVVERPLAQVTMDDPLVGSDEVLIEVAACGVCRTDLHIVEGELPAARTPLIPGHQIVGRVVNVGRDVTRFRPGDRAGVAWVNRFCGQCEYCVEGRENLCLSPSFTGYTCDGGYAELATAPAAFAHPIPQSLGDDAQVAPLLCAGIIGYRALKQAGLQPGRRLGLYGFGASAHIALQIARAWGCEVFVFSRGEETRRRAREMGALWAGDSHERPPRHVDHAITFAPVGDLIPSALTALRRGGTLAIAGIYLDRIPELDYDAHLFQERTLVSVTANTRRDARELLSLAANLELHTDVVTFGLADANEALIGLKQSNLGAQAAVLRVAGG